MRTDACPGALTPALVSMLQDASGAQPGPRWLYPYDATVFPRGIAAPVLQWEAMRADALYIHLKSRDFEYKGCFAGGPSANIALPQSAWDQAGAQSHGKGDPLVVELTLSAATASATCT